MVRGEAVLVGLLRRLIERGTLHVEVGGTTETITGRPATPEATITIRDPARVARLVLRGGGVGFAEAYIDGLWDTPDLAGLLEVAARNNDARRGTTIGRMGMRGARRLWGRFRTHRNGPGVEAMVDHYNLGNDFYARWLDPTMSYSSGRFGDGDDLESAQRRKYDDIAELASISPGDRVLEIGCGWGAMAEYLADIGCSVTAVTNSAEHYDFAVRRMKEAGVNERVDIVHGDFRQVSGSYERVVSVEMIESIDEQQWPDLYAVIERSLVPGGRAALQVITIDHDLHEEMLGRDDFIRSFIFPGGALPSIRVLRQLGDDAGLEWLGYTEHGASYARTLAAWERRFLSAWPGIAAELDGFDERFRRMWQYYFAYCQAGFRTGRIDGIQVAYRKPEPVSV
jgi:cyclopropane-fatty-acyl-phospholipid synthase